MEFKRVLAAVGISMALTTAGVVGPGVIPVPTAHASQMYMGSYSCPYAQDIAVFAQGYGQLDIWVGYISAGNYQHHKTVPGAWWQFTQGGVRMWQSGARYLVMAASRLTNVWVTCQPRAI